MVEKIVEEVIDKANSNDNTKNTYIDKDGFLTCSKCHTRKQLDITVFGRKRRVNCICKCENEADNEHNRKIKLNQYIDRLINENYYQKKYLTSTFAKDEYPNTQLSKIVRNYVNYFGEMSKSSTGLLFTGVAGTSKTYYSACICNALMEQGLTVVMSRLSDLSARMRANFKAERNKILHDISEVDLLVLDDLGTESNSPAILEDIYAIVDTRYLSNKPFLVSTNLTLKEMQSTPDIALKRIYSRVLERCTYVICSEEKRNQQGKETRSNAEKLLFDM